MIGVLIQSQDPRRGLDLIVQADKAGVQAAWLTTVGANRDGLELLAAAAVSTLQIKLGSAITPTWPRHPVVIAQQAQVVDALAPGRLIIGVGPSSQASMETLVGARWRTPLDHLREYVTVLKALLRGEAVDYDGEHVSCHARVANPVAAPVFASALRAGAYRVCGEVADGAISWMQPWRYVESLGLPALREGAAAAGRETPGVVYHVPVCVTRDRQAALAAAKQQLGGYARIPAWAEMYSASGIDVAEGYTDTFMAEYVISGSEEEVAVALAACLSNGAAQVIAVPVIAGDEAASWEASIRAIARAGADDAKR